MPAWEEVRPGHLKGEAGPARVHCGRVNSRDRWLQRSRRKRHLNVPSSAAIGACPQNAGGPVQHNRVDHYLGQTASRLDHDAPPEVVSITPTSVAM